MLIKLYVFFKLFVKFLWDNIIFFGFFVELDVYISIVGL